MASHQIDQKSLTVAGVESCPSGLMTHKERIKCLKLIKAYPIQNGTASTTWYSCPNDRRKAIFGQARKQLGPIFHALARQKECQIIEGHLMPDHVHMRIAIPPKHPVASVIGFLKGKSAIAMAKLCGKERNFTGVLEAVC